MAKVLVVTSGKGGVGKTTTTAAVGAALAQAGQKVVVVDFDVGLRNLDLVLAYLVSRFHYREHTTGLEIAGMVITVAWHRSQSALPGPGPAAHPG